MALRVSGPTIIMKTRNSEKNKQTGFVVAVGDDEVFETSRVKDGSKIYFIEKDYMPIGEFIIIKLSSIIGVFE